MQKGSQTEQGFNRLLASQMRPGASVEQARAVWGSRWQAPSRKDEGWVGRFDKLGFFVRLDRAGRVGYVGFQTGFPAKYAIEGLQLGMAAAAIFEARPNLKQLPDPEGQWQEVRYGERLSAGYALVAGVRKDKLAYITFESDACDYPSAKEYVPAPPGRYRDVDESTVPTFADPNLKLAVLDALIRNKTLDLGTEEELFMHVRGKNVDMDEAEYEFASDVYEFLARYPLTSDELDSVEELWLDASSDVVQYVWPKFYGESDEFHIRSFAGIEEKCPRIRSVCVVMQGDIDLSPLQALARLESFGPADGTPFTPSGNQLDALRARGVKINEAP
jgi:hypothetical protein